MGAQVSRAAFAATSERRDALSVRGDKTRAMRCRKKPRDALSVRKQRLADTPRPGRPRTGDGGIDPWIAEVIDTDPRALGYHQTVWTAPLLVRYLHDHQEVEVSRKTVSRAIARLDIRWKRPRRQLARRPDTWRQSKGG